MKKLVLTFLVVLFLSTANQSRASLIEDIPTQRISDFVTISSGGINYGWESSYDISFINQNLTIDVDVFFTNDIPSLSLLNQWEIGIESVWNNTFDIFDGNYLYDIMFNVNWVGSSTDSHHIVNYHNRPGRANVYNWYSDDSGVVAAHEFGHMIGLFDEYAGGASAFIRDDSIMGQNLTRVHSDHLTSFVDWLSLNSGQNNLSLQASVGDNHFDPVVTVPTPTSLVLLISSLLLLFSSRSFRNAYLNSTLIRCSSEGAAA